MKKNIYFMEYSFALVNNCIVSFFKRSTGIVYLTILIEKDSVYFQSKSIEIKFEPKGGKYIEGIYSTKFW